MVRGRCVLSPASGGTCRLVSEACVVPESQTSNKSVFCFIIFVVISMADLLSHPSYFYLGIYTVRAPKKSTYNEFYCF